MFTHKLSLCLPVFAMGCFVASSQAALVSFEFNTAGSTEGWTASAAPANALVTGFKQATGIDGTTGVITSDDVDIDPQVILSGAGNLITLPAGEKWSSFQVRFRHLTGNPGTVGVAGTPYDGNGTILFFNASTVNLGVGPLSTKTVSGTGAYAADVYTMTLTADPSGGEWQLLNADFSAAPTLNSANITAVRLDPVGNSAAKNFEVDYIRIASVPEPGSMALAVLAGGSLLIRRRR